MAVVGGQQLAMAAREDVSLDAGALFTLATGDASPDENVDYLTFEGQPVPLSVWRPAAATAQAPVIVMVHGGGWVSGSRLEGPPSGHARWFAEHGYLVISADLLRRAAIPNRLIKVPYGQHAFNFAPGAVGTQAPWSANQRRVACRHTCARGGRRPGRHAAHRQRDHPRPYAAILITNPALAERMGVHIGLPVDDLRSVIPYSGPYDFDTVLKAGFPAFRTYAWSYPGRKDFESHPRLDEVSTVRTATADYPPTYMTAGDADPLEPQTYELDAVLRAGVSP
ncbi:alpha/beta hydrolase [Actinokineospora pegani]|uniref:alpha/beta hydrolase n=1 Tax=Actinokineospora pegani TaxID=2654637 RepID=UPI0018D2D48F|nr:hypothetical protein [Actinokineospora pegani]